eukprot:3571740-Prymnesium_polylepis.1
MQSSAAVPHAHPVLGSVEVRVHALRGPLQPENVEVVRKGATLTLWQRRLGVRVHHSVVRAVKAKMQHAAEATIPLPRATRSWGVAARLEHLGPSQHTRAHTARHIKQRLIERSSHSHQSRCCAASRRTWRRSSGSSQIAGQSQSPRGMRARTSSRPHLNERLVRIDAEVTGV